MGNCQAIDNASLVIQHPNGRVDKIYCPVSAKEIMKMNPGHYVALLLTTTLYSSSATNASAAAAATAKNRTSVHNNNIPVRVTRIKLLKPTDNLVLGHVYRLVTPQEVKKGLWEKKHAKMKKQQPELDDKILERESSDFGAAIRQSDIEKVKQAKHERHDRSRHNSATNSGAAAKSRIWQPALQSISEAGS